MMNEFEALEKLRSIGQQELFNHFDQMEENQKKRLLAQVEALNIPLLRQEQMLLKSVPKQLHLLEPFHEYAKSGNRQNIEMGRKLICEGKVGCLILAGGLGSRLGFHRPKGCFPLSVIQKKSLFQIFAEKTAAAGVQAGRTLPLAIMTSPENDEETRLFFEKGNYFGLQKDQLHFFSQTTLPMLTHGGRLFLEERGGIALGPDGNGSSLKHFIAGGIWQKWYDEGVRYLNFVLIDNPLADPFDPELIGFQHNNADVVIKCTPRVSAEEKVGILVQHEDHVRVVEYSECPEEERTALDADGHLKHALANISLFSFSMDFVHQVKTAQMPVHIAQKITNTLGEDGSIIRPVLPNTFKFETFIFDVVPFAFRVKALLYPRKHCFSPLKSMADEGSVQNVQAALQRRDREIFMEITGQPAPEMPFELAQDFYYPTDELLKKWKGRPFPETNYVVP